MHTWPDIPRQIGDALAMNLPPDSLLQGVYFFLLNCDKMKTLILMRHAKSAWDAPELSDIDRPVAPRGLAAGEKMAGWLKKQKLSPQLILCSTARRARDTLDLIRPALPKTVKTRLMQELYMALPRQILTCLAKAPDSLNEVLVIGHNPGMHDFASWVIGNGEKKAVSDLRKKFPTAAVAVITFDTDKWASLDGEAGTLKMFVTPKSLG
jgi:phosphohistidine phosphatase